MSNTRMLFVACCALFLVIQVSGNSRYGGGGGVGGYPCPNINCPADCGRIRGPDGCFKCSCGSSVGAVGRPPYGRPPVACPFIGCPSFCTSIQVPGGCPRCQCPQRPKPLPKPHPCPQVNCNPKFCTAKKGVNGCTICECHGGGGHIGNEPIDTGYGK